MAKVCEKCGKKPMFGHNVSFSQRKTNRKFLPNLQYKRILVDDKKIRTRLCTQCLKTIAKPTKA